MTHDLLLAVFAGFLMGLQHATDADHVVAVSTLVSRARRLGSSWLLGAVWGLGHSTTLLAVGGAIVLLRVTVPARLALGLEFGVGGMLVVLGLLNLSGARLGHWGEAHTHDHDHEEDVHGSHGHHVSARGPHRHEHLHLPLLDRFLREAETVGLGRAFGIGMVHGLAGSSAAALLVLAAMPTSGAAMAYLGMLALGTLAGMTALSGVMEFSLLRLTGGRFAARLVSGTGLASVVLGAYVMYRIGFVEGLLR